MASMTTRAAVLHEPGQDWEITELDLDEPKAFEVLIRYKAAGLCHSDEHIREEGGSHIRLPLVGGHEGAVVGCGVTTGWCSAVRAGETRAGETVVIFGIGGVGINAVQGARYAGAANVIAIDPNPFKLEMASQLGATFTTSDLDQAREELIGLTRGQMADLAVVTVGVLEPEITADAVSLVGKAGRVVLTSVSRADTKTISLT